MKMNRTEWAVVILCGIAMFFVMQQSAPPPAKTVPAAATAEAAAPATPVAGTPAATPAAPATPAPAPAASNAPEVKVSKKNDVAETVFTSKGGGIREVHLHGARYAGKVEQSLNAVGHLGAIGAFSREPGDIETLDYTVAAETENSITWKATSGSLQITKEWTLDTTGPVETSGYLWKLKVSLANTGTEKYIGDYFLYSGIMGLVTADQVMVEPSATWYAGGDAEELHVGKHVGGSGFFGLGCSTDKPFITTPVKQMELAGIHNQYYAVVIRPDKIGEESSDSIWTQRKEVKLTNAAGKEVPTNAISAGVSMPSVSVAPGASWTWDGSVYAGPRSGTVLNALGGDRNQVMHYGMFRVLSRLFLGALNKFYDWTGVYGIAVMLLTIAVRLAIWPLHMKSTRAMKRMSLLAPMMQELKEKHKDNPQKMQLETMALYRTYGVNPVGGCLPMLFQFPIFLGYFGMLNAAVEMRGHSFLWAHDLSLPDTVGHILGFPINLMPLIMTVTMFIQMKMAPQPAQMNEQMAMQQKMLKFMPFMFLWFCYSYASALALYWTVQNIFGIYQTWIVKRQPEPVLTKAAPKASFFERAMEVQKQKQAAQQKKKPSAPRPGGSAGSAFRNRDDN